MKEAVKYKLDQIASVWNDFIWENKFCKRKIKFTSDLSTNYFGDILDYFHDTFDIIFENRQSKTYADRFSNHISLLQTIYVQQDFIEELLTIFKCGIVKEHLKKDINYSLNRDVRNELVGHPIRKYKGKFISSCLFGNNGESNKIVYLRYHKDNNYELELMEYEVADIVLRHKLFLETYFDKILNKLKCILEKFVKEIVNIEKQAETISFTNFLNILSASFESIFKSDFIYDKETLLIIYARKNEHRRYQNLIDKFYIDLKISLKEKKKYATEIFKPIEVSEVSETERPLFDQDMNIIKFVNQSERTIIAENEQLPITYHYELGKIATKRNALDFSLFGGILKSKCIGNQLIQNELKHMEMNIYDEIEYYTAYRLICTELYQDK